MAPPLSRVHHHRPAGLMGIVRNDRDRKAIGTFGKPLQPLGDQRGQVRTGNSSLCQWRTGGSSSRKATLSNVYYTLKRVDAFSPECIILFDGKAKSGANEAVHGPEYPADAPGKILVAARPRRRSRRAAGSHQFAGSSDGKSDPGIPREGRGRAECVRGRALVRRVTASRSGAAATSAEPPFSLTSRPKAS